MLSLSCPLQRMKTEERQVNLALFSAVVLCRRKAFPSKKNLFLLLSTLLLLTTNYSTLFSLYGFLFALIATAVCLVEVLNYLVCFTFLCRISYIVFVKF